jgi:hypothetical protein
MSPNDIKRGMMFDEVPAPGDKRKPRRVLIERVGMYKAHCLVVIGRGTAKPLEVWLKRLVDPARWARVQGHP